MTTQSIGKSHNSVKPGKLLRSALVGNATFSMVCGLVLIVGASRMAALLGVHSAVPLVLGVGLLPFAWIVLRAARRSDIRAAGVNTIIFMDAAWVVASALLLIVGWRAPTVAGTWTVVLVADMVATFGVLQWWGLRQVRHKGAGR